MGFWTTVLAVAVGYLLAKSFLALIAAIVLVIKRRQPPSSRFYD